VASDGEFSIVDFVPSWRIRNGPFVYRYRMPLFQGGEAGSIPARATGMRNKARGCRP
jgi:hypothetical protein